MDCQSIIRNKIYEDVASVQLTSKRRGRAMNEFLSARIQIYSSEQYLFTEYRQEEYDQYNDMIQSQIPRFKKYLDLDKQTRRLLIQFPADWYEDKEEDYMPCPESFLVQYNGDNYVLTINLRSTEMSRTAEDISIIKALCEKELQLPGLLTSIYVHLMNVHEYIDGGSSEDFDVTTGYFDKK